jgi:signal transduction histidine kinase
VDPHVPKSPDQADDLTQNATRPRSHTGSDRPPVGALAVGDKPEASQTSQDSPQALLELVARSNPGLGLGPLASLAGVLGGGDVPAPQALMAELALELDAKLVAWLPSRGRPICGKDLDPRAIDWGRVRALLPGRTAWLDPKRCPRSSARCTWQVMAAPARGVKPEGVLWIEASGPLALDADQLCALAGLVAASLERCTPPPPADPLLELGRRAAGLTHDLRNELTHALMQLERVRMEPTTDQVDRLASALQQAKDLCVASLPNAATPANGAEHRSRAVSLAPTLERARRTAQDAQRTGGAQIQVTCPADIQVLAEAALLARAVANLTLNAVEASLSGTKVHLRGRRDGLRVVIEVIDEGPGLSHEGVRSLFAPGRSGGGGTGWGTASVLQSVRELDATLELETAPGRGTTARILLPAPPAPGARLVLDPIRRRRARRLLTLAGPTPLAESSTPRRARALLREALPSELWVARGVTGEGLQALLGDAQRNGVRVRVLRAGVDLPRSS